MSKTRLANKTIWALEDIVALCIDARRAWEKAHRRAEGYMDPGLAMSLGTLSNALAKIERKAREARRGEYSEG